MERQPGAGVMRELEGQAEAQAGTFNAQGERAYAVVCDCVSVHSGNHLRAPLRTGHPGMRWARAAP